MATMKQVVSLATAEVNCKIESAPIPEPSDKQVLIKVVVSGSNPKDWKVPAWAATYDGPDDDSWLARAKRSMNHGDDIAGVVEKVGKDVLAFKVSAAILRSWNETKPKDRKEIVLQRSMRWERLADRTPSTRLHGSTPRSISQLRSRLKVGNLCSTASM
jgi:hypothetical protein